MLVKRNSAKTSTPVEGITRRILAYTEEVMLTEHSLGKGAILPEHKHPHEQIVYLLSGELTMEMNKEILNLHPGDSVTIPSNVTHKVIAKKQSVALDIFAPARMDYL